jgi:predicted nucleic acid-binding protein
VVLVDSNILIDILGRDPTWWEWSLRKVEEALLTGLLLINDVIFAEASIRYVDIRRFEDALMQMDVQVVPTPHAALFLAGKAFVRYRKSGGPCTGVLPDFFIGAHAEIERLPLLTRDPRRYRAYFPNVTLIAPEQNDS